MHQVSCLKGKLPKASVLSLQNSNTHFQLSTCQPVLVPFFYTSKTPFIHFKISFYCVSNKILTLAIIPELKLIFKIWTSQIFMFRSKTHSSPRRFWWKYEVNVFIIHHYLSMSHRPGFLSIVMF